MTTIREIEQKILVLIESSIEDTRIPDAIAAHADKRAGKPVTKTDAEQLEKQLGVPVRIRRAYGMTSVAWATGQAPNPWLDEQSIFLAHSDTNVRWPSGPELREKQPAHFGARDARNAARAKLLQEHQTMRSAIGGETPSVDTASVIYRAAEAIVKLREAQAALDGLVEFGAPLHVVQYAVEKLVGKE